MSRHALALSLGLLVVGAVAGRAEAQLSPGPLAAAHAKLDDEDSCGRCHSSGKKVDDAKCLDCHKPLAVRLAAGKGLHASYRGKACSGCHIDHLGEKGRLVRWPGGVPDKLDHAETGWRLEGKHADVPCGKCHDQKTPSGTVTYLGKHAACVSCHEDRHKGRLGPTCTSCHDQADWKRVKLDGFDHGKTAYPLVGKHAAVACKACHGEPPRYTGLPFSTCESCHKDPHAGRMKGTCESCHSTAGWTQVTGFKDQHPGLSLAAGHAAVACVTCHDRGNEKPPSKGVECVSCHRPVHAAPLGTGCKTCHAMIRWVGLPRDVGLAAHEKTRFLLRGKHDDLACAACHSARLPEARRYRGLAFETCEACHKDPHGGKLAGACAACHTDAGFLPTRFDLAMHARAGFALDGRHEAAPCGACHPGARPRLAFPVAGKECASCHPNPHGEQFKAEMAQGGCARCHTTVAFRQVKVDHSTWPLTFAHEAAPCKACHAQAFKGTPRTCDGCHADPHAGQFRLNAPVRACEDCHRSDAWKGGFPPADHAARFAFALTGKHVGVACDGCHRPAALHNGTSATRWRLGYRACRACHADPHGDKP